MPLVSVVIPTHNCETYIGETISSVLAQTYRPIEVIVVDDGSTDRTRDIVDSFGGAVRLLRQTNQRVCVARNRGFESSHGDLVCFLDHDDYWYPWKLERQVETFRTHPQAGVVFTAFKPWHPVDGVYPTPASLESAEAESLEIDPDYSGWVYHQFLLDCWALTSATMIRRDVFAGSGGFDPSLPYSEDWDLWLRLSQSCEFVMLKCASTLYRQHPDQGNLKLRDTDYRTALLERASRQWGLASRDGRRQEPGEFHRQLAEYHFQFALHQLQNNNTRTARASLLRAWRHHPGRLKCAVVIAASALGWRPR
jgi:glycosyltransferase involved in cell wall biosynthesis